MLAAALAVATTTAVRLAAHAGWLDPLEWATWSWRAHAFAEVSDADIRLILVDERIDDWLEADGGHERWPHDFNVAVIRLLENAGARALVFADEWELHSQQSDALWAEAMKTSGRLPVGLGVHFSPQGTRAARWPGGPHPFAADGLPEAWRAGRDSPIRRGTASFPAGDLIPSAHLSGSLAYPRDGDGGVRRFQPIHVYDTKDFPAVGLLPFLLAPGDSLDRFEDTQSERELPATVYRDGRLQLGERHSLRLDDDASATLRYRETDPAWPPFRYPTVSACVTVIAGRDVMYGERDLSPVDEQHCPAAIDFDPQAFFEDTYVFFGSASEVATPVGPVQALELHATVLDNLLTGDFLHRVSPWRPLPFHLALTFAAALLALESRRRRVLAAVAVAGLILPGLAGFGAYLRGTWWPIAEPAAAAIAACALGAAFRYRQYGSLAWATGRSTRRDPRPGEPGFDVFLSHNSRNKPVVRELADALEARGVRVWLDERELIPGRSWQGALEETLREVRSAAVLVGADGLGPWEIAEMRACLSELVDRGAAVIPVLLPGAPDEPDLPLFLAQLTWVDLRGGIPGDGLDRLEWGITGVRPGD